MQVRPIADGPRPRYRTGWRILRALLRWTFIVIGSLTVATVLFSYLYRVNETIYDPSLFAIGVGGLFCISCGLMLILLSRNSRLRMELRRARARCEELADSTWGLKEAEARALSLLEAQGDLIVRRDGEGRISYANDAYCALAGRSRDELIGTTGPLESLQQERVSVLADGTRLYDEQVMTATGPRWLSWRDAVVWAKTAACAEIQSVGRDVTERIEAEHQLALTRDAAEAASRAKSRFLAMVSHEIRTPLNGILGMTGLLLDTALTPEQTTYVNAAKTSGDALLALIEEILDFSKIEAGKLELDPQPFALAPLIEDVVELLAPRAQGKGLDIASDIDDQLPAHVVGDATRLRQVLLNLAGNAIKFTDVGGVAVVVEAGAHADEIVFVVHDTGIGIAPEHQARIFGEFEQADGGSARQFSGTGLGLAISRRIVEGMSGRIELDSAPGAGATFRVTIPLAAADSDAARTDSIDFAGLPVLLAAPAGIESSLLERRLTRWGADVTRIDPADAEAAIAQRRFSVLLADHASGIDSLDRLAESAVARRIVLLTPAERHRLPALRDGGFSGYLVKPIRAASLKAQLAATSEDHTAAETLPTGPIGTPAGTQRPLNVLVAEDNEINALLIRALLGRLGHRSTVTANGGEAIAAWQSARSQGAAYDLVLMDIHMPGIDGLDAARRIRAAEGSASHTPIVALTANAFAEDRDACLAAGMDGFLVKPLDRNQLAATLANVAGKAAIAA